MIIILISLSLIWRIRALYNLYIFYVDVIHFVAITSSDVNCWKIWIKSGPNYFGHNDRFQPGADTLTKCQQACELNPRCVSVDWQSFDRQCWINTNPNHPHYSRSDWKWVHYGRHYHLVRRCSITPGQCCHDLLTVWWCLDDMIQQNSEKN